MVEFEDFSNIAVGGRVGRDTVVLHHCTLSSVVAGDCQDHVTAKHVCQISQIASASHDVVVGVEGVPHVHSLCRRRHELHQSLGTGVRDHTIIVIRFDTNDGTDERFGHGEGSRSLFYRDVKFGISCWVAIACGYRNDSWARLSSCRSLQVDLVFALTLALGPLIREMNRAVIVGASKNVCLERSAQEHDRGSE